MAEYITDDNSYNSSRFYMKQTKNDSKKKHAKSIKIFQKKKKAKKGVRKISTFY